MIPKQFDAEFAEYWLDELAQSMENTSLVESFKEIVPILHEGFADNFSSTKSPSGTWPPHSPYTIAKYGPHPLLILSGAMLASVTNSGSDGSIEEVGPREMALGTSIFYAGFQQFGTVRIPARRFLWLDSPFMDRLSDTFAASCFTIIMGAGS